MYELIQLTERTYYIKSPTNIGLFRLDEKNVCLIDSGNDKDAGRKEEIKHEKRSYRQ